MKLFNYQKICQYIIHKVTCYDLTHFITEAVGYYECSSLEATGLDDIVQAAVSTGLDHSTKQTRRTFTWPWKRYHMTSCDHQVIFVVHLLDIIKAVVRLRTHQLHHDLNCQGSIFLPLVIECRVF